MRAGGSHCQPRNRLMGGSSAAATEGLRRRAARRSNSRSRGQSLAEFALVAPVAVAILAGIIQFGIVFWAQNTLTQVVRDTGRWEATQGSCTNQTDVISEANSIAASSSLLGYSASSPWTASNVTVAFSSNCTSAATYPTDNSQYSWVKITVTHQVPTFFPGMQYLPSLGSCDASGCYITLSTSAQYRLEPLP